MEKPIEQLDVSGFSTSDPLKVIPKPFTPVPIEGEDIKVSKSDKIKPVPVKGVDVLESTERREKVDTIVNNFLSNTKNPLDEESKIEVSKFLSSRLNVPFNSVYNNYKPVVEKIFGYTINPKKAGQFIKDQYISENISVQVARIYDRIARTPNEDHTRDYDEIKRLEESKPPQDPYKHNFFIDATGIAAGMIPYTWEVGKAMIPGAAMTLAAGAMSGGAGALPTAAAVLKTVGGLVNIWGRAKSFGEGYKLANGFLFGQLMETEDSEGNKIDEDIARKISLVASIPIAAVEALGAEFFITRNSPLSKLVRKLGEKKVKAILEKSAAKTLTKLMTSNAYGRVATAIAKRQSESFLYEVLLEEVPQDLIQMQAVEMAKQATNDLYDTGFVEATPEEWKAMVKGTIEQAAKGVMVMNIPISTVSALGTFKQNVKKRQSIDVSDKEAESLKKEDNIIDFYTETTSKEEEAIIEDKLENEQNVIALNRVKTEIKDNQITAKTNVNKMAGTIDYEIEDNTVKITKMDVKEDIVAYQMVQALQREYPDYAIISTDTDNRVSRAIEDTDTNIAIENQRIDEAKVSIELAERQKEATEIVVNNLKKEIENRVSKEGDNFEGREFLESSLKEAKRMLAEKDEAISVARETIDSAVETKKQIALQNKPKQVKPGITEYKPRFRDTEQGQELKGKLREFYSEDEANTAVDLIELLANAKGVSTEEWIKSTFKDEIVKRSYNQKGRAFVSFFEDGKALVRLTKKSDFSSWVHELGHILRRQLSEKEQKTAWEWAKNKTGENVKEGVWTVPMEEAFASGFESYVSTGKTQHKGIRAIFAKLARFMRIAYEYSLKQFMPLSDEIISVFENQLSEERVQQLEEEAMVLYQPDKESIKDALDKGYHVSDAILEQVSDEEWAKKELEQRKYDAELIEKFDWLIDIAHGATSLENFLADMELYMGEKVDQIADKDIEWFKHVYELSNRDEEITDINTGNKTWADNVDNYYSEDLIKATSKRIQDAKAMHMPASLIMAAIKYRTKKTISDRMKGIITATLKNNPAEYREKASILLDDYEEARQVQAERDFSKKLGIEEVIPTKRLIKERLDIVDQLNEVVVKEQVQRRTITSKKAEKLMAEASNEIMDSREKEAKLIEEKEKIEKEYGEKIDAMITSRNKEKREVAQRIKEAIAKEKARKAELIKKAKDRKKVFDYMRKLAKQALRKTPANMDAKYVEAVKILQAKILPKFKNRAQSKVKALGGTPEINTEKARLRKLYSENPEIASVIPESVYTSIMAKTLDEFTIAELEYIKGQIDGIVKAGQESLMARKIKADMEFEADKEAIKSTLLSHGVKPRSEYNTGGKKPLRDRLNRGHLKVVRILRILDRLDAGFSKIGQDYNGAMVRVVWDGITASYNEEIKRIHERQVAMKEKFKEIGLKRSDLYRNVDIRGQKMSISAILDVWAGWQNEKKRAALQGDGMRITPEIYKEMVAHLDDKLIALGEYIIEDYNNSYSRLREAFYIDKNILLEDEENYTPIRRVIDGVTAEELDVQQELMNRYKYGGSLQKGMGIKRQIIKQEHQPPIMLDIFGTWESAVKKEEHYINNVESIKHINRILADREINQAAKLIGKTDELREVKYWLKRYANPLANKSLKGWDTIVRKLKANAGIAYLAYSFSVVLKQIPSLLYFTAYTGGDIFTGIFSNFKESRALMNKYSPELTHGRSQEQFIELVKQMASDKGAGIIRQLGATGMQFISMTDAAVITMGWRSVYEYGRRHGLSEKDAARKATQAVLLTQPSSSAKDTAALYADDNMLSAFLMFTNQLNQIYLMLSYDMPQAIRQHQFGKAASLYLSSFIGAMLLWAISNRKLPKDDKDVADAILDQTLGTLPGIGKVIGSYADGYDLSVPVLEPLFTVGKLVQTGKRALAGKEITDKQWESIAKKIAEGFAITTGLPYTEADRIYRGFRDGNTIETILFGGKLNDNK